MGALHVVAQEVAVRPRALRGPGGPPDGDILPPPLKGCNEKVQFPGRNLLDPPPLPNGTISSRPYPPRRSPPCPPSSARPAAVRSPPPAVTPTPICRPTPSRLSPRCPSPTCPPWSWSCCPGGRPRE